MIEESVSDSHDEGSHTYTPPLLLLLLLLLLMHATQKMEELRQQCNAVKLK
jgi:hypothetical protein